MRYRWQVSARESLAPIFQRKTGPLSAFARRKAAQTGPNEVSIKVEAALVVSSQVNDEVEASAPPRKRRKEEDSSRDVVAIPAPPEEHFTDQEGPRRESGPVLGGNDSSDTDLSTDQPYDHTFGLSDECHSLKSEDEALPTVIARRLSTFPTKKSTILSDTDSEWRVTLHPQDVCLS